MFKNKEEVMKRVAEMEPGVTSESGHYWCVTCKMLFDIEKPVCPYMPKICVNTPIPVEEIAPESTVSLEKFGLFYPKIPQKLMAESYRDKPEKIGAGLVKAYFDFLNDWNFRYKEEPLQTLKSFIITISGSETAQRIREDEVTFIVMDVEKVWNKDDLFAILESSLPLAKNELNFRRDINLDSLKIIGDMDTGKYYCPMCNKFFEFNIQRDTVTCPLMAQKCMATPTNISKMNYKLDYLAKVYEQTPDIYRELISVLSPDKKVSDYLEKLLEDEWLFEIEEDPLNRIKNTLGLKGD